MKEVSFLAALRGRDGHSLARAVAILLFFNLFAGGLHTGAMASEGGAVFVLCSSPSSGPAGPSGTTVDHWRGCCLAGCQTSPVALGGDPGACLSCPQCLVLRLGVASVETGNSGFVLAPNARGPPHLA